MISNALRSRCEAIIRCEEKCAKPETKNENSTCSGIDSKFCEEDSGMATPKSNCPERCKAIFDHLINCPQLVTSKNKKEQKKKKGKKKKVCGLSTKKSLPASWKMGHCFKYHSVLSPVTYQIIIKEVISTPDFDFIQLFHVITEHTTESILNTTTESGTETTITATSLLPFTRVTGLKADNKDPENGAERTAEDTLRVRC
ncbi:hypothetical protein HF086_001432 [Spodoptera exigua]|uniref:Uncharacterized protein n=1 Tax=Spodoptera exigua TaxID=7107 RepID=A0A922SF99_SPOEX|nr:hypothetical protein HF086_001432 [Spodoptera exigua]